MRVNIEIERPDGKRAEFEKEYPTLEMARVLIESDLQVMDAIYAERYKGKQGRLIGVKEVKE